MTHYDSLDPLAPLRALGGERGEYSDGVAGATDGRRIHGGVRHSVDSGDGRPASSGRGACNNTQFAACAASREIAREGTKSSRVRHPPGKQLTDPSKAVLGHGRATVGTV